MPPAKTLVITHDHCALHSTKTASPERPKRLKWVMNALEILSRDLERELKASPLEIRNVQTSEPMLAALAEELVRLADSGGPSPGGSFGRNMLRSVSVGYLEEKILPAQKYMNLMGLSEKAAKKAKKLDRTRGCF